MKELEPFGYLDRQSVSLCPGEVSVILFQEGAQVAVGTVLHHHTLDFGSWIFRDSIKRDNKVKIMHSLQDLELRNESTQKGSNVTLANTAQTCWLF